MRPLVLRMAAASLAAVTGLQAAADEPRLPPGKDPGGVAVAVIADGFDTTLPDLTRLLARDGEGEAIAGDAVDGDHNPFTKDAPGTQLARAAAARGGVRLVLVRANISDPASLARSLRFASLTPARVVLVAFDSEDPVRFDVMTAAAKQLGTMLVVASIADLAADEKKADEVPGNLVLLRSGGNSPVAGEAVARALGCGRGALDGETGAELKVAFLRRLDEKPPAACEPEHGAKTD